MQKRISSAIEGESDRGVALLLAATLDNQLAQMLRSAMVDSHISDKLIFDERAPLSSFSARIDASLAMGQIDAGVHRDLEMVRKIRNLFAHHPMDLDFKDQQVYDQIRATEAFQSVFSAPPERKGTIERVGFLVTCFMISSLLFHSHEAKKIAKYPVLDRSKEVLDTD